MDLDEARRLLGHNVARLQGKVGVTQEQLADALGVHLRHVKAVEAGTRSASFALMVEIAEELGVHVHELLRPGTVTKRKPGRPKGS